MHFPFKANLKVLQSNKTKDKQEMLKANWNQVNKGLLKRTIQNLPLP